MTLIWRSGLLALALTGPAMAGGIEENLKALGAAPCEEDDRLLCLSVPVPLDHAAPDNGRGIETHYAVLPAAGERQGSLVVAMGGPGTPGVASFAAYIDQFTPEVLAAHDLIFFDQRGIGLSGGLACDVAMAAHALGDVRLADAEAAIDGARAFAEDCVAEMGADSLLPYVGTDQAVRDLEIFREKAGIETLFLYGESYGTQFAQTYAAAFPQATAGVIVDGVVDLTLDYEGFSRQVVLSSERILTRVFAACDAMADCARDMGAPAAEVYGRLRNGLDQAPARADFPLPDGRVESREYNATMLESATFNALYSPVDRADFLRAVAAAGRGDWVPLLLMSYSNLSLDPYALTYVQDPGFFPAAYWAILCADYDEGAGAPEEDAARIIASAREFAPQTENLIRNYFMERLVCAHWPVSGPSERPAPFAGGDFPTLVLNSDADPITPAPMAYAVLDSAANSAGVIQTDGSHVIFGWGNACPDDLVNDMLLTGELPEEKLQVCEGVLLEDYVPLTRMDPETAMTALEIAEGFRRELSVYPPYYQWDAYNPAVIACPKGGTVNMVAEGSEDRLAFADCRFWEDVTVNGTGTVTHGDEGPVQTVLELEISGATFGGVTLGFDHGMESLWLSGEMKGLPVEMPRPMP